MSTSSNGTIHDGVNAPSVVRRVVAWDWCDGPTEGLLQVVDNEVFHFRMLEEKPATADEDDVRIFGLYPLAAESLEQLTAELRKYQEPRIPVWQVIWKFPSEAEKSRMDELVETIKASAGPLVWIIATTSSFDAIRAMSIGESLLPA